MLDAAVVVHRESPQERQICQDQLARARASRRAVRMPPWPGTPRRSVRRRSSRRRRRPTAKAAKGNGGGTRRAQAVATRRPRRERAAVVREDPAHRPRRGRGRIGGQRQPRQVRLLHHRVERAAALRADRHRRRSVRRLHRALQEPRRGRLRRAARGARLDARERAGARARERDGDARAHGHPDVVRHDLQDARGHRRAAALGGRGVRRRAEQDAEQARVRPEGPVGSRSGDPRGRERGRGHQPAEEGDLRPEGPDLLRAHAVRPADRLPRCSRGRSATSPTSSSSCATCRSPRASTSRSATR